MIWRGRRDYGIVDAAAIWRHGDMHRTVSASRRLPVCGSDGAKCATVSSRATQPWISARRTEAGCHSDAYPGSIAHGLRTRGVLPEWFEGLESQRINVRRFGDSPVDDTIASESALSPQPTCGLVDLQSARARCPLIPRSLTGIGHLLVETGMGRGNMDCQGRISPLHAEMIKPGRTHGAVACRCPDRLPSAASELGVFSDTYDLLMTPTAGCYALTSGAVRTR